MRRSRRFVNVAVLATLVGTSVLPGQAEATASPVTATATATAETAETADTGLGAGGEYHPIRPVAVLDARPGGSVGPVDGALPTGPGGARITLDVRGAGQVPDDPADMIALVLEVKVGNATSAGDLVVYPGGSSKVPTATSVMFVPGRFTTSTVIVRTGTGGQIQVAGRAPAAGSVEARILVVGWIASQTSGQRGSRLVTVSPVDSFDGWRRLGRGETVPVQVRGAGAVPGGESVEAGVLSLTVYNQSGSTTARVAVTTTRPRSRPRNADMVIAPGQAGSTTTIVPLDASGRVFLTVLSGSPDAVVHVSGYTRLGARESGRRGRIVPLQKPFRSIDTRRGLWGDVPIGPGVSEAWDFAPFVDGLTYPSSGESVGPVGALFGAFTGLGHRRQYPSGLPSTTDMRIDRGLVPPVTTVVVPEGQRVTNGALARLDAVDRLRVYSSAGYTDYVFDVSAVVLQG